MGWGEKCGQVKDGVDLEVYFKNYGCYIRR